MLKKKKKKREGGGGGGRENRREREKKQQQKKRDKHVRRNGFVGDVCFPLGVVCYFFDGIPSCASVFLRSVSLLK